MFAELCYDYLVALDRSKATMWLQGGWLIAHAGVALLLGLPAYALTVSATGVALRGVGAALIRPLLGACAVAAVVLAVRSFTEPALLRLGLGAALAGLVYLPFVWPLRRTLRALG